MIPPMARIKSAPISRYPSFPDFLLLMLSSAAAPTVFRLTDNGESIIIQTVRKKQVGKGKESKGLE